MAPLLISRDYARFLFGLVWTGYVMIFDPIVYSSKGDSLLKDLEEGRLSTDIELVCGRLHLRFPVGILELLGCIKMGIYRTLHEGHKDL